MKFNSRYYEMASDDDCAYISSDDEEELEIKPPQAKIFKRSHSRRSDKHSHSTGSRHVYVSSSRHHHKSHHSHHQEDRYLKERFDSGRSLIKEYERKKAYHNRLDERYKEQDLREKLDRRKRHHKYDEHKEEDNRKERNRKELKKERHRHELADHHRNHDERRRRHREERKHDRSRDEKHIQSVSDDSISPTHEKNIVIDIETSPPVLRGEEYEREEEEEKEEQEEEEMEGVSENSESSSSSSSNDSNNSSSDASSEQSDSSESSSSEEEREMQENKNNEETNHVSENTAKEEASPNITTNDNDNDGVDSEIELEKDTLPSYYPAIQGCRSVEEFQCLNRIEEGTYGVVYRAREKRTDRIVALKRLKMEKEKNGFPITSLREINTLLKAQHPNIVTVKEIVVGSNMDKIFIVMDYVEHDLKSLMETMKQKKKCFTSSEVKCLMSQLLRAVNHLHNNWILHRDLKTSNLLFSHAGVLKVGDFGLAREYGSPLKPYTPIVVTLWYRAPELLLGTKEYSTSVDVWSVGCIFAELLCMEPLFPGKTQSDQLKRIFKALGTPNEKMWPEYPTLPVVLKTNLPECPPHGIRTKFVPNILSDIGYNLLTSLLCYNPKKRITAEDALEHDYFSEHPLAIDPAMFPTWPAKSEHGRKVAASSPKPPSGGQNYKELRDDDGFYIGVGERRNHPAGFTAESTFSLKF